MKSLTALSCILSFFVLSIGCNQQNVEQLRKETINKHLNMESQKANELKALVQKFYDQLSDPNNAQRDELSKVYMHDDWKSTPQPLGGPGRQGFVVTLGAFGGMIPDLDWAVQEMLVDGDQVVVRSIASGTPNAPGGEFFGVPTKGQKKFEVQTIDIHQVKDGKMVRSYHTEDWATAMQQVSGQ